MANPTTAAHPFHLWISHSIARSFSSVLSLRIGHTNTHKPLFSQTKPRLTVHNQPLYSIITPKHRRQLRTLHSPCIAVRKTRAWTNTYTAHRHVLLFFSSCLESHSPIYQIFKLLLLLPFQVSCPAFLCLSSVLVLLYYFKLCIRIAPMGHVLGLLLVSTRLRCTSAPQMSDRVSHEQSSIEWHVNPKHCSREWTRRRLC